MTFWFNKPSILIDKNSKIQKDCSVKENLEIDFFTLLNFNSLPLSSLMIVNNGLLFNEGNEFLAVEDFDLQINLVKSFKNPLLKIGSSLIYYRINTKNRNSGLQQKKNSFKVIEKYKDDMPASLYRIIYQRINYRVGKIELFNRNYSSSSKFFINALMIKQFPTKIFFKSMAGFFLSKLRLKNIYK